MIIEFKKELDLGDLDMMTKPILMVMFNFFAYCQTHNLPCKITSLVNDFKGKRVSTSHSDGRSFDASVRGWLPEDIDSFIKEFNYKYRKIAAISASDKKKRLIVYHDAGTGKHFHFQVRRSNQCTQ